MKKKGWLVVATIVCLAILAITLTRSQLHKLTQVVEMDGFRQREYKAYGAVPWPVDIERDPSLHVTKDGLEAISKSVKPGPEIDLNKSELVSRTIRGDQIQYYARLSFTGDPTKAIDFFQKELKAARRTSLPDGAILYGTGSDGAQVVITIHSKGQPLKGDQLGISVTSKRP